MPDDPLNESGTKPTLTLITNPEPQPDSAVVDLEQHRLERSNGKTAKPIPLLQLAIKDCEAWGDVRGLYLTVIREDSETVTAVNYRAGLDRQEEVAYRTMGMYEAVELWKEDA